MEATVFRQPLALVLTTQNKQEKIQPKTQNKETGPG